jgi:glutamyl-tRNA synthetase
VTFEDRLFGKQSYDVDAEVGGFLILRRNKSPAYQLAVVVDDDLDGVTEVVRGRDLLSSTARQIQLSAALGFERPATLHLPLVCDTTGRRLSKREKDLGLGEMRRQGVHPEQIVGWAAHRLGLIENPRRGLPLDFVTGFDVSRLQSEDILLPADSHEWFAGID